jgi:hypothetical protein
MYTTSNLLEGPLIINKLYGWKKVLYKIIHVPRDSLPKHRYIITIKKIKIYILNPFRLVKKLNLGYLMRKIIKDTRHHRHKPWKNIPTDSTTMFNISISMEYIFNFIYVYFFLFLNGM